MALTRLWGQQKAHRSWVDSRRLRAPQGCKKHAKDRDTPCSHETQKIHPQIYWEYWACKRKWRSYRGKGPQVLS